MVQSRDTKLCIHDSGKLFPFGGEGHAGHQELRVSEAMMARRRQAKDCLTGGRTGRSNWTIFGMAILAAQILAQAQAERCSPFLCNQVIFLFAFCSVPLEMRNVSYPNGLAADASPRPCKTFSQASEKLQAMSRTTTALASMGLTICVWMSTQLGEYRIQPYHDRSRRDEAL